MKIMKISDRDKFKTKQKKEEDGTNNNTLSKF